MSAEETDPEDSSDVRARRAERSKGSVLNERARRIVKPVAIVCVLALVSTGVWALLHIEPGEIEGPRDEMRHWHAAFKVYIDDVELDMHHCEFDLDGCQGKDGTHYIPGHLHYDEPLRYMLHIEHPVRLGNVTFARYWEKTGFELTNTSFRLDTRVYDGELYENNSTHRWRMWVSRCIEEPPKWVELASLTSYHPFQHDRILLTYTNRTFEDLAWQFESIPDSNAMLNNRGGACPNTITLPPTG